MNQIGIRDLHPSLLRKLEQETMLFWLYFASIKAFIVSPEVLAYFGLAETNTHIVPLHQAQKLVLPKHFSRIRRIFTGKFNESHIIEEFKVLSGPHKGESMITTAGIIARAPDNAAALISGVITSAATGNGRFFTHAIKSDGTWDWDGRTGKIEFSNSYKIMMGYASHAEEFPQSFAEWCDKLVHPEDSAETVAKQMAMIESPDNGDYFESCVRLRHYDGHYIWSLGRGMVLSRDASGHATRVVGYNTNINLLAHVLNESTSDAYNDALTGLYNREYLALQKKYIESPDAAPLVVCYVDITGLKACNDFLGHDVGDDLIKATARILRATAGDSGILARIGGDEMVAIIPHCTPARAEMIGDNIKTISATLNEDPSNVPVIPSFGMATLGEEDTTTLEGVLSLADARCQETKRKHKEENMRLIRDYIFRRINVMPDLTDERITPPQENMSSGNGAGAVSASSKK